MRYEWKVGQEVVHWWNDRFNLKSKVIYVTPTGLCRVEKLPETWGPEGYERGRRVHPWNSYITPYDDEAKKRIEDEKRETELRRKVNAIRDYNWRAAPDEIIEQVYALVKPEEALHDAP